MPDNKQNTPGKMAAYGAAAGVASTIVMDVVMFALLGLMDKPTSILFTIIAESTAAFLAIFGITIGADVTLGVVLHYLIGLGIGLSFALMMIRVSELQTRSTATLLLLAILFTELISIGLLVPAAIILGMSRSETVDFFGSAFLMHALWGAVLGLLLNYLRARHLGVSPEAPESLA